MRSAPRSAPGFLLAADPPLVIASRNAGKLREFRRLLAPYRWRLRSLDEAGFAAEMAEPGPGYAENARAKADAVAAATGLAALGDDSGIEVRALDDWPGPRSARWLGPGATDAERAEGIRAELRQRSAADRRCRYVAAVAMSRPGRPTVVVRGECEGELVAPSGDGGFGYDPVFLSADLGMRFAMASDDDKDRVSHRARAIAALAELGALGVR